MAKRRKTFAYRRSWQPSAKKFRDRRVLVPGGSINDLTWISETFGVEFSDRLASAVGRACAELAPPTANKDFWAITRFLRHVVSSVETKPEDVGFKRVFASIEASNARDFKEEWEFVIEDYYSMIEADDNGRTALRTKQNNVLFFNAARKRLFELVGWPNGADFRIIRGARQLVATSRLALGELSQKGIKPRADDIGRLNIERLHALRSACEDILIEQDERFEKGARLIEELSDEIFASYASVIDKSRGWSDFRASNLHVYSEEILFSIAIRYIRERLDGGADVLRWHEMLLERITRRTFSDLLSYLEGTLTALIATSTIMMIDTGLNVTVVEALAPRPITRVLKTGRAGVHTMEVVKPRAGYKQVRAHLVEVDDSVGLTAVRGHGRLSAVAALKIWEKLSASVRAQAVKLAPEKADRLWIYRGGFNSYSTNVYPSFWHKFVAECQRRQPALRGLAFSRASIRPTYVQIQFATHSGDAGVVAAIAGHSSTEVTLKNYLSRPHLRRFMDLKIIDFQEQLEAVFGNAAARAAQLLIDTETFEKRRAAAFDNGIGYSCASPMSGHQPDTAGKLCWKVDACSKCALLRFRPTPEAIRDLVWFKTSLDRASTEFIASNPDRWVKVWLPALALSDAIIELLTAGPHAAKVGVAQWLVDELISTKRDRFFSPW